MVVICYVSALIVHPAFHLIIFHRPRLTMTLLRHPTCSTYYLALTHPYGSTWFSKFSVILLLHLTQQTKNYFGWFVCCGIYVCTYTLEFNIKD